MIDYVERNKTLNEILRMNKLGICTCTKVRQTHLVSTVKAHLIDGSTVSLYIYFCTKCKYHFGLPVVQFELARTLASPALVTTFLEFNIPLSEERRSLDTL